MPVAVFKRKTFFGRHRRRVTVYRVPRHTEMYRHRHEFCEIVVVLSGTGLHVTGAFRREITAGDVLVINSRRAHGYERTRGLNLVNILAHNEALARIVRPLREEAGYAALFNTKTGRWKRPDERDRIQLTETEQAQAMEWIDRLEAETRGDTAENAAMAEAWLTLLVGLIARRQRAGAGRTAGRNPAAMTGGVGGVVSWIEQNLDKPITVAALARRAGMSERTLHRKFRETTGSAPVEYVLEARVRRAGQLLTEGQGRRRVAEVAQACGFADSNYFSTCFRRLKGCSPREFGARARRFGGDGDVGAGKG